MNKLQVETQNVAQGLAPALGPAVQALMEFARLADDQDDGPALDEALQAVQVLRGVSSRAAEIRQFVHADAFARFNVREFAALAGILVRAIANVNGKIIDEQLARLQGVRDSANAAIESREREAARLAKIQGEIAIAERARKLGARGIIQEAEAHSARLSADSGGRIIVAGQLPHESRLMIAEMRDQVVSYLQDRQRTEVL